MGLLQRYVERRRVQRLLAELERMARPPQRSTVEAVPRRYANPRTQL